MTNKENLILDLTNYDKDNTIIKYSVEKNYLILKVLVSDELFGTIKLKNFGKKNVAGIGSVSLLLKNSSPIDLNTFDLLSYDNTAFSDKGIFTGTRFSETINATGVEKNTTIKGGAGYNIITGTDGYTDKITGGNDGNYIVTGNGDKTITTGSGEDKIEITGNGTHTVKTGNGDSDSSIIGDCINKITTGKNKDDIYISGNSKKSTLYLSAGENTVTLDNSKTFGEVIITEQKVNAVNNIKFTEKIDKNYYLYKIGNDLQVINNNNKSSITLKSFFASIKKKAVYSFIVDNQSIDFKDFAQLTDGFYIYGKKKINGTDYDDTILTDDSIIRTKSYNDVIKPGKGTDIINAGLGNNTIYLYKGDGTKTILNGNGIDTLVFSAGTNLNFDYQNNDLIITYGDDNDKVLLQNYADGSSVQYIQIGKIKDSINQYFSFLKSGDMESISISDKHSTEITLYNKLNGKEYRYLVQAVNNGSVATFEYLANGRLVINGDNLKITASQSQTDDIILLGDNNSLDTGDCDDIVRLGYVIDSDGYYEQDSYNNSIYLGDGNDHITYFGSGNAIDAGNGDDVVLDVLYNDKDNNNIITNSESTRYLNQNIAGSLDYQVDSFSQGNTGGDCRLLALLQSYSLGQNYSSLEELVTITEVEDGYNIVFKNCPEDVNYITVTNDDISNFGNVYGDLDVVLIDCGLDKLLDEYGESVVDASYNLLSGFIFGNMDITFTDNSHSEYDFVERLSEQWEAYKNGEISNIIFGTLSLTPNTKLGIVKGHAYAIEDYKDGVITLINPWDNMDHLTLELNVLMNYRPCVISFGTDYYDERIIVNNTSSSAADYYNFINQTQEIITAWSAETSDIVIDNSNLYDYDDNILCVQSQNLQIFDNQ